jgi:4-diphosphocytidyl-2-C-methyl-D-erythritol kinase
MAAGFEAEGAPFKINLMLKVVGKRADGYHCLETLFAFADGGDRLTWRPGGSLRLEVSGPFADAVPPGEGNLVLRAARALADAFPSRAAGGVMHLEKHIPSGAGLGGGSADAAAALRLLNRVWQIDSALDDLARIAAKLGADVPVCLFRRPAWARGVGNELTFLPVGPDLPLLVLHPARPLATADVFGGFAGPFSSGMTRWPPENLPLRDILAERNDLESAACQREPVIADVLADFKRMSGETENILGFGMSGSGSSCFLVGLPDAALQHLALRLRSKYPLAWLYDGLLKSPFV